MPLVKISENIKNGPKNLKNVSRENQPKWSNIEKSYKNHHNSLKSYCCLGYFQILFNFENRN
jgi:hypothetical protein